MQMLRQKVAPLISQPATQKPMPDKMTGDKMAGIYYTQPTVAESKKPADSGSNPIFDSFMVLYNQMQRKNTKSTSHDKAQEKI